MSGKRVAVVCGRFQAREIQLDINQPLVKPHIKADIKANLHDLRIIRRSVGVGKCARKGK